MESLQKLAKETKNYLNARWKEADYYKKKSNFVSQKIVLICTW